MQYHPVWEAALIQTTTKQNNTSYTGRFFSRIIAIDTEALAGAAFITSAVSVGFAPASGAVGAGTGFGATGKLEYSFCRSGPGRTSEETPQPRPALRPNLHRSSSHAPHSKTCRCNSVNVSGTEVQLLLSQLHSTGQSHQVEGRNSVLFVAGGAGGASANKL